MKMLMTLCYKLPFSEKDDKGTKTFKVAISALVDVDALNAFHR